MSSIDHSCRHKAALRDRGLRGGDGVRVEEDIGWVLLEKSHKRGVGGRGAVGIGADEAQQRLALDPVVDGLAGSEPARQRFVHARRASPEGDDAVVVVDAGAKPEPPVFVDVGAESLVADLVLLYREGEPVDVALLLDLGRLPVPLEPADRGAVADQFVVVELRPLEPGPPLGGLVALVVADEVRKQAPRLALLGPFEQLRFERFPLGVLLLGEL